MCKHITNLSKRNQYELYLVKQIKYNPDFCKAVKRIDDYNNEIYLNKIAEIERKNKLADVPYTSELVINLAERLKTLKYEYNDYIDKCEKHSFDVMKQISKYNGSESSIFKYFTNVGNSIHTNIGYPESNQIGNFEYHKNFMENYQKQLDQIEKQCSNLGITMDGLLCLKTRYVSISDLGITKPGSLCMVMNMIAEHYKITNLCLETYTIWNDISDNYIIPNINYFNNMDNIEKYTFDNIIYKIKEQRLIQLKNYK
jgi:hypothetical protein